MPLPYIPFADTAEVVIEGTNSGFATFLTMAFTRSGGFSTSDLSDLGSLVEAWVTASLVSNQGAAQEWNLIRTTDLSTESGPVDLKTLLSGNVGTHSGDTIPVQVAMVVSFYTANRGRSFRGRNYVPGLTLNQMSDGSNWGATAIANIGTAYDLLKTDAGSLGDNLVVLSRFHNGVRRSTGVATLVTSIVPKANVGTQRRRVSGHGI